MKPISLRRLLLCLLIPLLGGGLASLLAGGYGAFSVLNKPPLSPPGLVFPIVWSLLYLMMGFAAYRVTDPRHTDTSAAMTKYYAQLLLNFLWPILFFRFRLFALAAAELVGLIVVLIAALLDFRRIDKTAGRLLLPYLVWCLFALYLNVGVSVLN